MEYNKAISELGVGDEIEGFYVLKGAYPKTTAAGKPFLSATLADQSGEVDAKVWDYNGPIGLADEGKVIKIRGTVSEYRGALQVVISRIRLTEPADSYDPAQLVPVAPIDADEAFAEIQGFVTSLPDHDYAAICRRMLELHAREFQTIPAAKSVHHGFLHGLLMHTASMMRIADFLAGQYPDTVDRSLLLAGTLLHDFAKAREFEISELGLVSGYSVAGQLLGHLVMGAQEVAKIAEELQIPEEKSMLLQHMLLSHHGEPEHGAAVVPLCAESELLSLIDLIDSKMEIYREAFDEIPVGEFSSRIFALEKRIFHHA